MFEVSMNIRNNILTLVACIALGTLSQNIVCYAQNRFLSYKLLTGSQLSPLTEASSDQNIAEYARQPICFNQPTGCTEEELAQAGIFCTEYELNLSSSRKVCVQYQYAAITTPQPDLKSESQRNRGEELLRNNAHWNSLENQIRQDKLTRQFGQADSKRSTIDSSLLADDSSDIRYGYSRFNRNLPRNIVLHPSGQRYHRRQSNVITLTKPELPMTNNELFRRLNNGELEIPPQSASGKILLVQYGAIQNQRRSSALASYNRGNIWSPVNLIPDTARRLIQRSDDDSSDSARTTTETQVVDGVRLVNKTTDISKLLQQPPKYPLSSMEALDNTALECTMRRYTFRAVKQDASGNRCTGMVQASICYGGCETGEIADWLFPHKKPIHKVCTHGQRLKQKVILTECSSTDVDDQLREYHYIDAISCVCQKCNSKDTNCVGSLVRPHLANLEDPSDETMIID